MTSRTFLSQRILQNATVANLTWQPDTIRFDDFLGCEKFTDFHEPKTQVGLPAPIAYLSIGYLLLVKWKCY